MKQLSSLEAYLQASEYIDYFDAQIQDVILSFTEETETKRIQAAFEFVRDQIDHSFDIKNEEVTRKASEVLNKRHGICYAKSHLLTGILRGMGIPSGICYQRLTLFDKPEDGYCLHALNTVYLREHDRWIRLDARGNKEGIDAQFSIDKERLAFPVREEYGEKDYEINYAQPHPVIIQTLETYSNAMEMYLGGLPEDLSQ